MTTIFISVFAGVGLGLLTWYGWGLLENLAERRAWRAANAARDKGSGDATKE